MGFETILTQQVGPSFIVTLDRPKRRNAVDLKMMEELIAAARQAEAESSVRALIITGGKDYFSAGADLNDALAVKSAAAGAEYFGRWHQLNATLEKLGKPVIAALAKVRASPSPARASAPCRARAALSACRAS